MIGLARGYTHTQTLHKKKGTTSATPHVLLLFYLATESMSHRTHTQLRSHARNETISRFGRSLPTSDLSIYLSIYLSVHLSIYLSGYLSICLSVYLSRSANSGTIMIN